MQCRVCSKKLRSDNTTGFCRACYLADYKVRNREMLNEKLRKRRYANVKWQLLHSARARAKRSGIECTIVEEDIWIPERCPLLGIEIGINKGSAKDSSPSLDRFDSSLGYTPENIWVISHLANRMKSSASAEQIDQFARSWFQMRGIAVYEVEVFCPACQYAGPHQRIEVAPDGTSVTARCAHNDCRTEFRVVG